MGYRRKTPHMGVYPSHFSTDTPKTRCGFPTFPPFAFLGKAYLSTVRTSARPAWFPTKSTDFRPCQNLWKTKNFVSLLFFRPFCSPFRNRPPHHCGYSRQTHRFAAAFPHSTARRTADFPFRHILCFIQFTQYDAGVLRQKIAIPHTKSTFPPFPCPYGDCGYEFTYISLYKKYYTSFCLQTECVVCADRTKERLRRADRQGVAQDCREGGADLQNRSQSVRFPEMRLANPCYRIEAGPRFRRKKGYTDESHL